MYSNQKGPQATSFLRFSLSRHHGRAYPRPYTLKFCPSKNCPVFSCHEVSGVLDKTHNPPSFVLLKFPWFGPNFKGIAVKSVVDLSADSSGDVTPHSWQKITGETPDVCSDKRKPRMLLRLQRRRTKNNRRNQNQKWLLLFCWPLVAQCHYTILEVLSNKRKPRMLLRHRTS